MTGPEHYRRAEQLLGGRNGHQSALGVTSAEQAIALAQVHATLALAAATVADRGIGPEESSGWRAFHADESWAEAFNDA